MNKTKKHLPRRLDKDPDVKMIGTAAELAAKASQQNRRLLANEIVRKIGLPPIKGSSGPRFFY